MNKRRANIVDLNFPVLLEFTSETNNHETLTQLKSFLSASYLYLESEFKENTNVRFLVQARAQHVDTLLIALWQHLQIDDHLTLIAVGGYGRAELHPYSDIDLLILSQSKLTSKQQQQLESYITLLWDCHLKVGHSVRTVSQCTKLAKQDITITTNLMESRFLIGNQQLFDDIKIATAPDKMWEPSSFFEAKTTEQKIRYHKFEGSSFDLEPNLKSSPGGLRDIHLIGWLAQRVYYPKTLYQLIRQNVITKKEYYTLIKCQLYIWRVRFALHLVAKKTEDRLLFDYQKSTAEIMRFKDSENSLAVEKMMQRYYRSTSIIRNICDVFFQLFEQQLFAHKNTEPTVVIDKDFQIINQHIDIINPNGFIETPKLLLQVFQHIAKNNVIKGITPATSRALRAARYKINNSFRANPDNQRLFVDFWHILHTSSRAMFLMKRSGILADYLKCFKKITGKMQYDMFHNYTVDEHTLFLLRNLAHFASSQYDQQFPLCSQIMQKQKQPEIIFIAGLFHDIAKGRGGDHSELGALEVMLFCENHGFDKPDSETIQWLVANHLIMSLTAQKRDLTDPKVIEDFAHLVGNKNRLELLYILTIADIRATSNTLWNSWKDSLLKELYRATNNHLKQSPQLIVDLAQSNQRQAKEILLNNQFDLTAIESLWGYHNENYFEKHNPESIAWQTNLILSRTNNDKVIGIRNIEKSAVSEVFVYNKDQKNLFGALTATLDQKSLKILAANIYTDDNGYCYDSFFVLDKNGNTLDNKQIQIEIKQAIIKSLNDINKTKLFVQRREPRQLKYFSIPTEINFFEDEYSAFTRMELISRDRPGLLAAIAQAFVTTQVKLHDAKITTLGEKVEDTFIISQLDNLPINDKDSHDKIRHEINRLIDK